MAIDGQIQGSVDNLRRLTGPLERAGNDPHYAMTVEHRARLVSLILTGLIEGNVGLALGETVSVPIGFAVAKKKEWRLGERLQSRQNVHLYVYQCIKLNFYSGLVYL